MNETSSPPDNEKPPSPTKAKTPARAPTADGCGLELPPDDEKPPSPTKAKTPAGFRAPPPVTMAANSKAPAPIPWEDQMGPNQKYVHDLIHSHGFEGVMGSLIMVNLAVMIVETDRTVHDDQKAEGHWTEAIGFAMLVIFILEMILRIFALRCVFFRDVMNVFDFCIVSVDAGCTVLGLLLGNVFPVSILRVFRLTKMARVSKVLRVFPELRLLMAGLLGSISAIWWGTVLLCLFLLVWSMVAVLFIHPLNKEIDYDGSCERCPRAYSSVMQAMLTFSQQIVAGDSWGTATIPMIEHHPYTALFFLFVFLTIGMSVMNLILGVVVTVATEAREAVLQEDKSENMLKKLESSTHLLELCAEMDKDGSGELDAEEIMNGFRQDGTFRESLLSMEVTEEDLDVAFWIVDADRSGTVEYKEFVHHIYNMRTSNTEHMLALIKYHMVKMEISIVEKIRLTHETARQTQETAKNVEQGITKMASEGDLSHESIPVGGELEASSSIQEKQAREINSSLVTSEADVNRSGAPTEFFDGAELKGLLSELSLKFDQQMTDMNDMSGKFVQQMSDLIGEVQASQMQTRTSPDLVVPLRNPSCISSRRLPACCGATARTDSDEVAMVSQSSIIEPRCINSPVIMRIQNPKDSGTSGGAGTN